MSGRSRGRRVVDAAQVPDLRAGACPLVPKVATCRARSSARATPPPDSPIAMRTTIRSAPSRLLAIGSIGFGLVAGPSAQQPTLQAAPAKVLPAAAPAEAVFQSSAAWQRFLQQDGSQWAFDFWNPAWSCDRAGRTSGSASTSACLAA